jgi:hypothetical protein
MPAGIIQRERVKSGASPDEVSFDPFTIPIVGWEYERQVLFAETTAPVPTPELSRREVA